VKHLIFTLLVIAVGSMPALAKYSGGTGISGNPYQIANVADLMTLANDANDYNKCFVLTADIDLDPNLPGNQVFTNAVIANGEQIPFAGVFDGSNNKVRNLVIDTQGASGSRLGLFGATESDSNIRELRLENALIHTGNESGRLGLLVGYNAGNITNCSATGRILAEGDWTYYIGGLIGWNEEGTISRCRSDVSVSGFYGIGGLVGVNNFGVIFQCCAYGETIGADGAGGLVAGSSGTIIQCYATGRVVGTYNGTGGLVGSGSGTILNCYATGEVSGNYYVGGLDGGGASMITNSYSSGRVSGEAYVGGLAGNGSGISNCYFLDIAGPNNGAGTPLTDTQMKQQGNFVSWDFVWETANGPNDIWAICEGVSYPKLAWQFIAGDSDNDKDVDFTDFAPLANKWMQADSNLYCGGTDLTGDGLVNLDDLAALAENWLQGF
jgi:hypothetical protein